MIFLEDSSCIPVVVVMSSVIRFTGLKFTTNKFGCLIVAQTIKFSDDKVPNIVNVKLIVTVLRFMYVHIYIYTYIVLLYIIYIIYIIE